MTTNSPLATSTTNGSDKVVVGVVKRWHKEFHTKERSSPESNKTHACKELTRNVPDTTSVVSLASSVDIWKARLDAFGGISFLTTDPLEAPGDYWHLGHPRVS